MLSIVPRSCSFSRATGNTGWRVFWKSLSSCVSVSMYLCGKEIEAGRLNEDLIAPCQLQLPKALLADFDFDQFLVFPAVAHQFQAHYRANRENVRDTRRNGAIAINTLVDAVNMNVMRAHIGHG